MKLKSLLTTLAAAVGLTTAAVAATTPVVNIAGAKLTITNTTDNAGNYSWINTTSGTLKLPTATKLTTGMEVKVKSLMFYSRGNDGTKGKYADTISLTADGQVYTTGNYTGSTATDGELLYTFPHGSEPVLKVGTTYNLSFAISGATGIRYRAGAKGSGSDGYFKIGSDANYAPQMVLIGEIQDYVPTASWNQDLYSGSSKGDYKMSVYSGTAANASQGKVTLTKQEGGGQADTGVAIRPANGDTFASKNMTFLVKYSGLSMTSANTALFSTLWGSTAKEQLIGGNTSSIKLYTDCTSKSGTAQSGVTYSVPAAGVLLITVDSTGRISAAFAEKTDSGYGTFTEKLTYSNISANSDVYGVNIGGCAISPIGSYYRPAMVVEGVAVFETAMRASDFNSKCTIADAFAQNPRVISFNVAQGSGSDSGAGYISSTAGDIPTLAGVVPAGAWLNGESAGSDKTTSLTKEYADGAAVTLATPASVRVQVDNLGNYGLDIKDDSSNVYSPAYMRRWAATKDETAHNATVTVSSVPYKNYKAILYISGDYSGSRVSGSNKLFYPITVNGTQYTVGTDGLPTAGSANWGDCTAAKAGTVKTGTNVLVFDELSGELKVTYNSVGFGIAAIQIVEVSASSVEYTATMTGDASWSDLEWSPSEPPSGAIVKITNNGSADVTTLTFDTAVSVKSFTVESEAGKELKFSHISNLTAAAYDFSAAKGGIGYDVTGGWTVPELLRNYIRDNETKVTFYSSDTKGATLTYSNSGSGTFKSHFVFDGGTHSMTYCGALNNATADNPSILVKDGTTLDFYGHDMGGWTGSANIDGIIAAADGGRINLHNTNGTFYYHQRFTLNPGSDMYLAGDAQQIRFQGGCVEGKELFYVPDSTTAGDPAVIHATDASKDTIGLWNDSTIGIGIYVGNNSALEIENAIKTQNGANTYEIKKWGAGKLTLNGSLAGFTGTGNGKGKLSMMAGDLVLGCGGTIPMTLWASSSTTVEIAGDADTTFSGPISGGAGLKKTGAGTATLSGANDYTGTTTVEAGTLKVTGSLGTGNYTVAEDATIDLGSVRPTAKLVGTSVGTVNITISDEDKTTLENGGTVETVSIEGETFAGTLKAFDTAGAAYEIGDLTYNEGKIFIKKKEGARMSPYLTTNPAAGNWTAATWTDSSTPALEVRADQDWENKVGANITVEAGTTTTLTADRTLTLGTVNVSNAGTLTLSAADNALTADELIINNTGTLTLSGDAFTTADVDDTASTGATTISYDLGTTTVKAGANTILATAGTGTYTIGSEKKLTVKSGSLTASQISNSGTLNFEGGDATTPIALDGNANFGTITLAENTYVKHGESAPISNRKYLVSGQGATSVFALWRNNSNGSPGMLEGSSFSNLILVSDCNKTTDNVWLERATVAETVGLKMISAICLNGISPTVRSLTGTGKLWPYSSAETITVKCTENADFAGECAAPVVIVESSAVQTFSGSMTSTLTVNENATVKLAGNANPTSISGAGTVILAYNGEATLTSDLSNFTGTIVVDDSVTTLDFGTARPTATFSFEGTTAVKFTEKISEDGVVPTIKLATGSEEPTVKVIGVNGDEKVITSGKYAPTVTGKAALWAWEFNGTLASTGRNTGSMGVDNGQLYTDEKDGIYAYSQPYNGLTWPTEFTTAIACTLPTNANVCLVGWGQASPGGIALTSGDVLKHEVKMVYWQNNKAYTTLATMSVPNASTCEHLYVFTKTADSVKVYLDGSLVVNYTGSLSLGVGVQVGTVYQGVGSTGLVRLDNVYKDGTNSCKSVVNTLRVYDTVLGANAMAELVAEFPYDSPNGTFTRALEGTDNQWVATDAWTKVGDEEKYDAPTAESTVKLTAAEAATVTLNLNAPVDFEAMNLTGEGTITIAAADANANKISCSGTATIGANAVIKYSAMSLASTPITIAPGKTLTIDASMVDLTKYFADATITMTGLVNADDAASQLKCTLPTAVGGRTVAFAKNESNNTYELQITVPANAFNYADGTWTWGDSQTVDVDTVSNNKDLAIAVKSGTLEWPMDRATIKVEGGTLKATSVPASTTSVTVESGATFDLNGQVVTSDDKVLNVTLNGGTLANSGEKSFLRSLTLTASSTIATGTGKIGLQSRDGGWAATTLTLGENTLTKTGTGTFSLVMTTISGTGLFDITDGEFYISENQDFGDCPVQLSATSTLFIRGGKTMTVGSITAAEGAVINNDGGTLSAFTLTGAVALVNKGTFGVITLDDEATIDIGQKRGLTINEAGTVKATITDAEKATDSLKVFKSTSDTKPTVTLVDEQGAAITGFPADYDDDGNYVVQFSTSFTIADVDNATKAVEGATLVEGNTYKATLGTEVTVTYTANDGYHFGDGTPSVTVKATAAKDIEIKTSATTTKYPVKIGSTYYLTLAAALDAAEANADIQLCDNVTFAPNGMYTINKTIYLTLNKFNLTGNGGKTFEVVNNAAFYITATGSTVEGVRINVGKATDDNGALYITGGTWTIDNNTLVHVNGTCKSCYVTIQDATMTSNGDNAIQLCGAGTYVIDGGTITGATAVYAKAGTLSVAAELVANGAKKDYEYSANGANATGDAIVIDNCGYPEGPAAVSLLTGTTLSSTNADKMGYYVYNGSAEGTVTKAADVEVNTPENYLWKNGKLCKKVGTIYFAK